MLSILIPIYNYDARLLVQQLHQQALSAGIEYEILLLDDASDNTQLSEGNRCLKELSNVTIFELPTKAGRAVARNFLAGEAKYNHLLFLDCDSEPIDDKFIERYIPYCKEKNIVVCGGTAYKPEKPATDSYLRWIYGVKCETQSAAERNKAKKTKFFTFNFLIDRDLFWSIRFNELLKSYGHEDTIFGLELQKKNCHITHIDNPLYHIGIDNNITYIKKTRQGVENLKILLDSYEDREQLIQYIRLLQYYSILEKTYTIWLGSLFYRIFRSLMESNFKSKHPNLTLFNLYKLGYLSYIVRRKKYQDSNL